MRTSYSAINTYQVCPLQYKYKNIDKIKEPKSKEQVFGTLIHSVLQYVHTPGFTAPTLEQALDFYGKNWNSDVFEEEVEERSAFSQGVEMIQKYYKKESIAEKTIVDLESRFEIELDDKDNQNDIHIISGIIDRIDKTEKGYEIIDYKTTRKMPSQDKVDKDIQLSIYLRAFLKRYPKEWNNLKNLQVSLYFVKHGVKLSATRTRKQLEEVDKVFLDIIHEIEKEKFEPQVGPLCDWCGFKKICPMWRHSYPEERKYDSEEVQKLVNDYIELKEKSTDDRKKAAELQEQIAGYMDQEGVERVFGDNKIIERGVRQTFDYDPAELKRLLEPIGKWDDVIKVNGTAVNKLIKELPFEKRTDIENAKHLTRETKTLSIKKKK